MPPLNAEDHADELDGAAFVTSARNTALPELPSNISARTRELTTGIDSTFRRVRKIAADLEEQVYSVEETPGHALVQLSTLVERDPMVAFDEQYAALLATMLRSAGIPARVVVGFVPAEQALSDLSTGEPVEVHEADIEAWVEVPFIGHGWVAFEAGPPDTQTEEIDDGSTDAQRESIFATPPPPPTSTTSTTVPQAEEEDDEKDSDDDQAGSSGLPAFFVAGVLGIGLPMLLFVGAAAVILGLKARRRTRRRNAHSTSEQIFGAYRELIDRSLDVGLSAPPGATARQTIAVLAGDGDDPTTRGGRLVAVIEDAGYSPVEPDPSTAQAAWENSIALAARFDADMTPVERVRARLSLRSLRTSARGGP